MKQQKWLLLLYQIPAKSDTERVRLWRGLQKIGAVMVKNSVSAVPKITFFRKAIVQIANEITASGGEAIVTEAKFLSGLSTESLIQSYNMQIDVEFKALAKEIREATKNISRKLTSAELMRWEHKRTKFNSRMGELEKRSISSIDGVEQCKINLSAFEKKMTGSIEKKRPIRQSTRVKVGSTWVTRRNIHADRLASAWLIKKYIDKDAHFLFVDMDLYKHKPENIRFDVFKGEFGHIDDKCTFEVLVESFKLRLPALITLAEVIHDLDIQDQKYDRKETEGIRMALDGIIRSYKDDRERLLAAMNLFDSLILSLKKGSSE